MKLHHQIISILVSLPSLAFAQASGVLVNPTPGGGATLKDFIYLLIEIIQLVGIPVLVVVIIYAGFLLMTAGDNEQQRTKGKMWVVWVLIGATIILGAQVIADMIYGTASAF